MDDVAPLHRMALRLPSLYDFWGLAAQFVTCYLVKCRYPLIELRLKGNQSCYTSAYKLSQSINNVCLLIISIYVNLCPFMFIV